MRNYKKLLIAAAITASLVGCGGNQTLPSTNDSGEKPSFQTSGNPAGVKADQPIAIASFRVLFVTEGKRTQTAADKGRWGSTGKAKSSATIKTTLTGVDSELMQQITDNAYRNFSQGLTAQGFNLLPLDKVTTNKAFQKLEKRENGQSESALKAMKKMFVDNKADLKQYPIYSPTGLPLLEETFMCKQLDPLFQSLCLPKVASDMGVTLLHVSYVVDYSSFDSSAKAGKRFETNSVYASAKVSTGQNIHLLPGKTGLLAISPKGKELYFTLATDNPYQGVRAFGETLEATSTTDKAVSGFKNTMGMLSAVAGGSSSSDSTVTYEMQAKPAIYQAIVNDMLTASSQEMVWGLEYFKDKK